MTLLEINNISKALQDVTLGNYNKIINTTEYNIPEDSLEEFENITKFVLCMETKDSELIESTESLLSKEFSKLLVKYYYSSLDRKDVLTLLELIYNHNNSVDNTLSSGEGYLSFLEYAFGFNSAKDGSLIQLLITKIKEVFSDFIAQLESATDREGINAVINTINSVINFGFTELSAIETSEDDINTKRNEVRKALNTFTSENYLKMAQKYVLDCLENDSSSITEPEDEWVIRQINKFTTITDNDKKIRLVIEGTNTYRYVNEHDKYKVFKYNDDTIQLKFNQLTVSEGSVNYTTGYELNSFQQICADPANRENKFVVGVIEVEDEDNDGKYFPKTENTANNINYSFKEYWITNITTFGNIINVNNSDMRFIHTSIKNYYEKISQSLKIKYLFSTKNQISDEIEEKLYASQAEKLLSHNDSFVSGFNLYVKIDDNFKEVIGLLNKPSNAGTNFNAKHHAEEYIKTKEYETKQNEYYIKVSIIYKEFNPVLREIGFLDLIDCLLSYATNDQLFNTDNHEISNNIDNWIRSVLISSSGDLNNFQQVFLTPIVIQDVLPSLKFNCYKARRAREADIIRYFSGTFLNYGVTSTEINEITNFIEIYEETRDYFYRNLLNKALIGEDNYQGMERMFITTYSIERFISSKLDNLRDIDLYNAKDIHNFLVSYGLKSIDGIKFSTALESKKKIIYNYKDLMKLKGSDSVVKILLNAFNTEDTEVELSKYLIFPKYASSSSTEPTTLTVAPIDYINNELPLNVENIQGNVDYEKFISSTNDGTWTTQNVSSQKLMKVLASPTSTKYTSLTVTQKVISMYIKLMYALSYIELLNNIKINNTSIVFSGSTSNNPLKLDEGIKLPAFNTSISNTTIHETYSLLVHLYDKYLELNNTGDLLYTPANLETYGYGTEYGLKYSLTNDALNDFNIPYSAKYEFITVTGDNNETTVTAKYSESYKNLVLTNESVLTNSEEILNEIPYILRSIGSLKSLEYYARLYYVLAKTEANLDFLTPPQNVIASYYNYSLFENIIKEKLKEDISIENALKSNGYVFKVATDSLNLSSEKKEIKTTNYFINVFTDILYFPYNYIMGKFAVTADTSFVVETKTTTEGENIKYETITIKDKIDKLFTDNFLKRISTSEDTIIKRYKKTENIPSNITSLVSSINSADTTVAACYSSIIEIVTALQNRYNTTEPDLVPNFGIREDNEAMLEFITESVRLFLSYTSHLYQANMVEEYSNTYSNINFDICVLEDMIIGDQVDHFYYDELIEIIENENNEDEEGE